MENGCLARVNLIGMKRRPGTVPGIPLKGLMTRSVIKTTAI
jgi:predicted secreted protein